MYIRLSDSQYPISEKQIEKAFPNVAFPKPFKPPEGYAWVFSTPKPEYDPIIEMVRETAPVLSAKNEWEQQWEVVSKFTEYTDDGGVTHTVAEQEQEAIAAEIARLKAKNAELAKQEQEKVLSTLAMNAQKKSLGLPPEVSDEDEASLKEYAKAVQADIDNPPETEAYNPPLPPGVSPPAVNSILITITREPGYQGNIGWEAIISSGEENFTPANLAMAEYTNPNCDGYLYTTGAFQQDAEGVWFAQTPPGQEKGDVDIHLGLLYGAAQLSCFTFKAGNQEQKIYAFETPV